MPSTRPRHEIHDQSSELPRMQVMIVFITIGIMCFIATLDTTCVSTAMPKIAADLNAGASVTWVGTAMLVASTTSQVIISRLSDIFGRKSCLQVSLVLMAFGNVLCGFAKTPAWLYAARGVAGLGAGGIMNLSLIIMSDVVSLRDRGKYVSLMGIPTALGLGLGPEIGGALAEHGGGWRWVFWVTVPAMVVAVPVIWICLPLKPVPGNWKEKVRQVDWVGSMLSLAAFVLILVPISAAGTSFAWSSAAAIAMITVGSVIFVFFLITEHFHPLPAMPLHLFKNRTVALVLSTNFLVGIVWFGNFYIAPLYYQNVLGYSAVTAGALMLPLLVGQLFIMVGAGMAVKKWGKSRTMILVGYFIWTAGQGMQIAWPEHKSIALIVIAQLIQSVGFGLTSQTTLVLAQASCAPADRAVVTGMRNVFRNTGGAVGLAIANAIINSVFLQNIPADLPAAVKADLHQNGFSRLEPVPFEQRDEIIHAYYLGIRDVFIMYTPVVAACFVLILGAADTNFAAPSTVPTAAPAEETAIEMSAPLDKDAAKMSDRDSDSGHDDAEVDSSGEEHSARAIKVISNKHTAVNGGGGGGDPAGRSSLDAEAANTVGPIHSSVFEEVVDSRPATPPRTLSRRSSRVRR